jgi:hypothetical protein
MIIKIKFHINKFKNIDLQLLKLFKKLLNGEKKWKLFTNMSILNQK